MNTFGKRLAEERKRLELDRDEFGQKTGVSPKYLVDIESRGTKRPKYDTLIKMVRLAACESTQQAREAEPEHGLPDWHEVDVERALDLFLAVLGVPSAPFKKWAYTRSRRQVAEQAQAPAGSEVWIQSDVLLESSDDETAREVASNIRDRRITYRYFVPFYAPSSMWKNAIERISHALGDKGHLLRAHVSVYRISNCAFTCRLGIIAPRSENARGSYNLGGEGVEDTQFAPAPIYLVKRTAATLMQLCNNADRGKGDSDPGLGVADRVFPPATEGMS